MPPNGTSLCRPRQELGRNSAIPCWLNRSGSGCWPRRQLTQLADAIFNIGSAPTQRHPGGGGIGGCSTPAQPARACRGAVAGVGGSSFRQRSTQRAANIRCLWRRARKLPGGYRPALLANAEARATSRTPASVGSCRLAPKSGMTARFQIRSFWQVFCHMTGRNDWERRNTSALDGLRDHQTPRPPFEAPFRLPLSETPYGPARGRRQIEGSGPSDRCLAAQSGS